MTLRSPLARVLGRGSAKEGTGHWWMQRVTSVALALLGAWFLVAMLALPDLSQATMRAWIAEPLSSLLLVMFGATLAYHSSLGVQVVIEDYVHGSLARTVSLLLNRFAHIAIGTALVFAVLRTAFGAAG